MRYHINTGVSHTNGWRLLSFLFIGISFIQCIAMLDMSTRVEPADLVYQVCNQSRTSADIDEHGCGALQDQLGMEFLCQSNNTDPATHCWVEEK